MYNMSYVMHAEENRSHATRIARQPTTSKHTHCVTRSICAEEKRIPDPRDSTVPGSLRNGITDTNDGDDRRYFPWAG